MEPHFPTSVVTKRRRMSGAIITFLVSFPVLQLELKHRIFVDIRKNVSAEKTVGDRKFGWITINTEKPRKILENLLMISSCSPFEKKFLFSDVHLNRSQLSITHCKFTSECFPRSANNLLLTACLISQTKIYSGAKRQNTADHSLRHYTHNVWKLLIFAMEISQSEQQRLKSKKNRA